MNSWMLDLRDAWRGLMRDRGFTWVALLALALGISANIAACVISATRAAHVDPVRALRAE